VRRREVGRLGRGRENPTSRSAISLLQRVGGLWGSLKSWAHFISPPPPPLDWLAMRSPPEVVVAVEQPGDGEDEKGEEEVRVLGRLTLRARWV
jgi:hypothetical protein